MWAGGRGLSLLSTHYLNSIFLFCLLLHLGIPLLSNFIVSLRTWRGILSESMAAKVERNVRLLNPGADYKII